MEAFRGLERPASYLSGPYGQILSHILRMRSKTGIETWPGLVSGTYRKIYFCRRLFMHILAQRFAPEKDTLRTIATF